MALDLVTCVRIVFLVSISSVLRWIILCRRNCLSRSTRPVLELTPTLTPNMTAPSHFWEQPLAMNGSACQHTLEKEHFGSALDGFKLPDSDSECEDRLTKSTDELLSFWRAWLWERKLNTKEFWILMSWCAECAVKTCARFALRSGNSRTARCLLECQWRGLWSTPLHPPTCRTTSVAVSNCSAGVTRTDWRGREERLGITISITKNCGEPRESAVCVLEISYCRCALHRCNSCPPRVSLHRRRVKSAHRKYDCLSFRFSNCFTGRRFLRVVARKKTANEYGNRGWGKMFPISWFIRWSLRVMTDGCFPSTRHDDKSWESNIVSRALKVVEASMFKVALSPLMDDWSESIKTLDVSTWTDSIRPCFERNGTTNDFAIFDAGQHNFPFHVIEAEDYDTTCIRCDVRTSLDARSYSLIGRLLVLEHREDGSLTLYSLRQRVRLGSTTHFSNVTSFQDLVFASHVTCTTDFCRRSEETLTR